MASYHTDRALGHLCEATAKPERIDQIEPMFQRAVENVDDPSHRRFMEGTFEEIKENRNSPEDLKRIDSNIERYGQKHWPHDKREVGKASASYGETGPDTGEQISGRKTGSDGQPRLEQGEEQIKVREGTSTIQNTVPADQERGSDGKPRLEPDGQAAPAQNVASAKHQQGSDGKLRLEQETSSSGPTAQTESSQQESSNTTSNSQETSTSRERSR